MYTWNAKLVKGKRFNRETLEIRYKGKSISDVLEYDGRRSGGLLRKHPENLPKSENDSGCWFGLYHTWVSKVPHFLVVKHNALNWLRNYPKKIPEIPSIFWTEPTTGLHFEDIRVLMEVINKLVDKGNTDFNY